MATERRNIIIPEDAFKIIREAADRECGGNLSRYLVNAGLYYARVLKGREEEKEKEN